MSPPASLTISGLHITGQVVGADGAPGNAGHLDGFPGDFAHGGGILDESQQLLTVLGCLLDHCLAQGGKGGDGYSTVDAPYPQPRNGGLGGNASGGAIAQTAGDMVIQGCTLDNNNAIAGKGGHAYYAGTGGNGGDADGGGLQCEYSANYFGMINSTFTTNWAQAGSGGHGGDAWGGDGILSGGTGGNGGSAYGGGIYVERGCLNCSNPNCRGFDSCTVYANTCDAGNGGALGAGAHGGANGAPGAVGTDYGCGVYFVNIGCLKLANTIVAGDAALPSGVTINGQDICVAGGGVVTSLGWNLIGIIDAWSGAGWVAAGPGQDRLGTVALPIDPLLNPLQWNAADPTPTMAPMPCSPVIDAGKDVYANGSDQVFHARPDIIKGISNGGDGSDIGAYELQVVSFPLLGYNLTGAGFIISWAISSGGCYQLVETADLVAGPWVNTLRPVIPNFVTGLYEVTIPLPLVAHKFYRLRFP